MLGGLPDHRQKAVDLRLGQPRAGIRKDQRMLRRQFHGDLVLFLPLRIFLSLCGDRIHGILKQFPDKDLRRAVQMV